MIMINIPMPENCMDCPCLNHENGECQITGNRDTYTMERPRSCPLTEIEKTGHWIWNDEKSDWYDATFKCSCCDREIIVPYESHTSVYTDYPYCHCGAKMESEE